MVKYKGIMAMEEFEEFSSSAEEPTIEVIEHEMLQGEMVETELDQQEDQIEEACMISDKLDEFSEMTQATVDSGEGMEPQTIQAMDMAIEHFCSRLQYKKKVLPALEGFNDKTTRLEQTKFALENINKFKEKLNANLVVAQEGMIDRIYSNFNLLFQTSKKILTKIEFVSKKYDEMGPSQANIIDPAWRKYINIFSPEAKGTDVIKAAENFQKIINNAEIKNTVSDLTKCVQRLTNEVRGNWFLTNKKDLERIEVINQEITSVVNKVNDIIYNPVNKNYSEVFIPATPQEKTKLIKLAKDLLEDNSLDQLINSNQNKQIYYRLWSIWNKYFRLRNYAGYYAGTVAGSVVGLGVGGIGGAISGASLGGLSGFFLTNAQDMKKANIGAREVFQCIRMINDIVSSRMKISSAIVSYIAASTNK